MGLFKKDKNLSSKKDIQRFHNKRIKYAVERNSDGELVLGRNGGISILDDEIVVLCEAHEVFRCKSDGAVMAELMSLDGVMIKGIDSITGEKRHIVAYYEYYRKIANK